MCSVASLCEMGFAVVNTALNSIFLTIGIDALQMMYSLGLGKGFQALMERSYDESDQATVDDPKDFKQEGVSADKAEKAEQKKISIGYDDGIQVVCDGTELEQPEQKELVVVEQHHLDLFIYRCSRC